MDIERVKEFIATCPFLPDLAPLYVDFTAADPSNYGIADGGETTISTTVTGRRTKRHAYVLFSREYTAEDINRIENLRLMQRFQEWIEAKNDAETFPVPPADCAVESMWAENGVFMAHDESGMTGQYQIQFYIIYEEAKR